MAQGGGRLALAGRIAAIPGGYVLASLASACLARLLPTTRVEAASAGMVLSFGIFAALLIWAFSARSVLRLWLWTGGSIALLGILLTLSILHGGRA